MNFLTVATYFTALNWPRWYTIHLWRVNIITFLWRWTIDILHLLIILDEIPRGLTFHAQRAAMVKWLQLSIFLRPALLIGNHRHLSYMASALGFSKSYTRIGYRIMLYSIWIWRYLTVWYFDSLSNRGFIILIMINNIWRTLTIIDNLTTYKYNRNFDIFVTLEESVELWRRRKIPKIYFLLQFNLLNLLNLLRILFIRSENNFV